VVKKLTQSISLKTEMVRRHTVSMKKGAHLRSYYNRNGIIA